MSDELDIEAIEARLNAATPGPWCAEMDADKKATARDWREVWAGSTAVVVADGYERHSAGETETVYGVRIRAANAALIANAPEDLRALLAEIRRLTEERDGWRRAEMAGRPHQLRAHRLLSDDSALPADIRERAIPGSYMLATLMDLLEIVAKERDAARCERDAARNALAAVGVVIGSGS